MAEQKTKPVANKADTYINKSSCAQFVCGVRVKPGAEHAITAADKKQEKAMKRLERAIKLGLLVKA